MSREKVVSAELKKELLQREIDVYNFMPVEITEPILDKYLTGSDLILAQYRKKDGEYMIIKLGYFRKITDTHIITCNTSLLFELGIQRSTLTTNKTWIISSMKEVYIPTEAYNRIISMNPEYRKKISPSKTRYDESDDNKFHDETITDEDYIPRKTKKWVNENNPGSSLGDITYRIPS